MIPDSRPNVILRNRNIILSITIRIHQQKVSKIIIGSSLKRNASVTVPVVVIVFSSQKKGCIKKKKKKKKKKKQNKTNQFIVIYGNNWNIDFLGARENILIYFTVKNIDANKMNLGTSVLAGHG